MIASSDEITPFDGETPRRDAVRSIGAASAALLGMAGLGAAASAKGKNRSVGADKKKKHGHKHKNKRCKCPLIGLSSSESEPFSLSAGTGVTKKAVCPDGSAWVVNVFCSEATNTDLRVGVICFSRKSFQLKA